MTDYVKSTNFAAKDSLASGNINKIVKGTEIDTEFTNIATSIATKADLASPTFTGTPAAPTATVGTNTTQIATTAFVTTAIPLGINEAVITNAREVTTVSATSATGTIAIYPNTQSVLYYTSNASANWTVNLTYSASVTLNTFMSTGQSLTVAFLVSQGSTAYYNSTVQVDGTTSGVTTKWLGGAPTQGNPSGIDVYTYTVIKTASATFTVLASATQYK